MKKKRDKTIFLTTDNYPKKYSGRWIAPGSLIPIPTKDDYKHSRRPLTSPLPSPWKRLTAWLRYHSIQTRWDIERWLARKLHRRWT